MNLSKKKGMRKTFQKEVNTDYKQEHKEDKKYEKGT